MVILRIVVLLILYFLAVHGKNNCQTSYCSSSRYILIRFPFRLPNQPLNCGYPGFDLTCDVAGRPVLNLPNSGSFLIRSIDYRSQTIMLYDQDNCIQSRLFDFNLSSSSPFQAMYYQNYTFAECPADYRLDYIACLSNFTSHTNTVAFSSTVDVKNLFTKCKIIDTRPIAVQSTYWRYITYSLNDDLMLNWKVPNCIPCESQGRICELKDTTSKRIHCHKDRADMRITQAITAAILVPFITLSTCILCYKYRRNVATQVNESSQNSITSTPQASRIAQGLHDSTIQSYAMVTLGESRRISGPNSTTCPICLDDYLPKDILRCIPQCDHCFHAHCIDEWLKLKSICPVCRNSPS